MKAPACRRLDPRTLEVVEVIQGRAWQSAAKFMRLPPKPRAAASSVELVAVSPAVLASMAELIKKDE
jgi:hypothetical protein